MPSGHAMLQVPVRRAAWALLVLRLGLAAIFLPYGLVKLFTFPVRVQYFASQQFPAPAVATGFNLSLEIAAGLLLVLGLRMPVAATLVFIDTLVILTPLNWSAGPLDWWPQMAVRLAPALALALLGPGAFHLGSSGAREGEIAPA